MLNIKDMVARCQRKNEAKFTKPVHN